MRTTEQLETIVRELCRLPQETEWVEFKCNNDHHEEVGEYVSALANSAAIHGRPRAYLVWGVEDETHRIVGTTFLPKTKKVGNECFENWLLRSLKPQVLFEFFELTLGEHRVVLLEMHAATSQPVQFNGHDFVRVGSYKKKLKEHPEKERVLWRALESTPFEHGIAAEFLQTREVMQLLEVPSYFALLEQPKPADDALALAAMGQDDLVKRESDDRWSVTNLGAILFASRLHDFQSVRRKPMRLIAYQGRSRVEASRELALPMGYATGFVSMMEGINGLTPTNEVIEATFRRPMYMYPPIAVRELVANALIHQDFHVSGAGPMVEVFDGRIEITNPGEPLIPTDRFLDNPPKSRNEALASLMRRFKICEERGSGIDKVVRHVEIYQLPAPVFEVWDDSTRATLFAHRKLLEMDAEDRIRACYLHACLKYVNHEFLTNTSIRERFRIDSKNAAIASRLIREAREAGRIAPANPDASPKQMKYIPAWAASRPAEAT